jgi:uncharacterized protein (TIGR03435 family)
MRMLIRAVVAAAMLAGSAAYAQDFTGTWQGTLNAGKELRIVFRISGDPAALKAVMHSLDQGGQPMGMTSATAQGSAVRMALSVADAVFEGRITADGKTIIGTWTQGGKPLPLTLTKATPETAWALPAPATPMAANAPLTFEVATIKPSVPGASGKGITIRGREIVTYNTSLNDLITLAYDLHPKQLVGATPWMDDKYDITGKPEATGVPNIQQIRGMLKALLAERFKLAFHLDKKELSVYAVTVAKTGSKIKPSASAPTSIPGLIYRKLGLLNVVNATMAEFASVMQTTAMDRPVVDQTGLAGRFDFTLEWTPDETQFASMGVRIPSPTNEPGQPPGLFTAIQEQLGLRMDATKAPADAFVIDRVERPSEN